MISDHDPMQTMTLAIPPQVELPRPNITVDRRISILGVPITDVTRPRAIQRVEAMIRQYDGRTRAVFFANAHTLNLAAADPQYRAILNSADMVFGDGTGVRWAARIQGTRVCDNVNGTDLLPEMFHATAGNGYRYFLLGADETVIHEASKFAARTFDGWIRAGFHHGYLADEEANFRVIRQINESRPDLLLVGMGNPRQERWIHEHRRWLDVPVCMGVGGLFDFWSGIVSRAPERLRSLGHEWLWRLWQQPDKARRYLLGNPLFLARVLGERVIRPKAARSND